jgi:anti-sigma factor RsiW
MDHQEAQAMGAVERYLLGELDPAARDAFEEHFFGCRECATDVRCGAAFVAHAKEVLSAEPAASPVVEQGQRERRAWLVWFWPMPAGALAASAALLVFSAFQGFFVLPQLRRAVARTESIQAVPGAFLSVSRAAPQLVTLTRSQRHVALTLSRSSMSAFAYYRCTLSQVGGPAVLTAVVPAPPRGEELQLLLPLARLASGDYVLAVGGMTSEATDAAQAETTQYHFTIRFEEGAR